MKRLSNDRPSTITTRMFRREGFRIEITLHDNEVVSIYIYLTAAGRGINMLAVKDQYRHSGKLSDLLALIQEAIAEVGEL